MISRLFARGARDDRAPLVAAVAPEPFGARARKQLEALSVTSRRAGRELEPAAYSSLRHIEDILRPAIEDAVEHPILPEREHAIETMLTDLIPNTIAAYLRISDEDRIPGSPAATSLDTQLRMLGASAAEIAALIKQDAVSALQANAYLLQSRLN